MMTKYEELQINLKNTQYTWLVTGVAGFIGSNLLEKLLILNQKVVGLDNFETGYQHNINQALLDAKKAVGKDVSNNFNFIHGDIREIEDCQKSCNGVDYVLHQAALGSVPRSIKNPIKTNEINIGGFVNMILAAKNANVKRFVYASSSSVYGDSTASLNIESALVNPLNPYSVTKVANELYAQVFEKTDGFKSIGLRYFNVFGKRQNIDANYSAVIPKWIMAFLKEDEILINGDGEISRDFCYIDNAIQMNLLAATTENSESESTINRIYNVALNNKTDLNSLYKMLESKLMEKAIGLKIQQPTYTKPRAGDMLHSLADISKAQKNLGYCPQYQISEGLDKTVCWYVNQYHATLN